jgi:hypothetical protein
MQMSAESVVKGEITQRFEKTKDVERAYDEVIGMFEEHLGQIRADASALETHLKKTNCTEEYIKWRLDAYVRQEERSMLLHYTAKALQAAKWAP